MRIRTHIILMTMAIVMPVIVASAYALLMIRDSEREAALERLKETARATSLLVDKEIQGSLGKLKALGNSRNLALHDLPAFYREAALLNQMPDAWMLLYDAEGNQLVNTVALPGAVLPKRAAVKEVAQVLATREPVITGLLIGPVTQRMLIGVHAPAAADGGNSYVVAEAFGVGHWTRTALHASLPSNWIVAVIDRDGKYIARSHKANQLLGQQARPTLVKAAAGSANGLLRHVTNDDVDSYTAFTHSALTGWTIAVAAPVESVEAPARRALEVASIGILLAMAVAAAVAAAFGRQLVGAIEHASIAAVALGKGIKARPKPSSVEEVNQLNSALLDAGILLEAERGSRESAEAERERLLTNETVARQRAQAENEAKDRFLATLGHELRNPLAAISGAVRLLERAPNKERTVLCVGILKRQNGHLERIVNDLLDVSRLVAGKIVLEEGPLNLAHCVAHCVESLESSGMALGHHLDVDAEAVWVRGDGVRIEQILNNLITNALKFSPVGSHIEVEVYAEGGRAHVEVHDHGVGIAAELLPRVFDPFVQGPPPPDRASMGLGIGLALVKQLALLHGGDVSAASDGVGKGSTFRAWLPQIEPPQRSASAHADATGYLTCRVIYAEDDADLRTATAQALRLHGFEVIEVADGKSTYAAVLAAQPDVVLMDIGLPDMNGYAVARELKLHPETSHIPLIALTGYGQLQDKEQATLAGFAAHLVKPAELANLLGTIEAVVSASVKPPSPLVL